MLHPINRLLPPPEKEFLLQNDLKNLEMIKQTLEEILNEGEVDLLN